MKTSPPLIAHLQHVFYTSIIITRVVVAVVTCSEVGTTMVAGRGEVPGARGEVPGARGEPLSLAEVAGTLLEDGAGMAAYTN